VGLMLDAAVPDSASHKRDRLRRRWGRN
jgi:hypothetical protein